LRQPYCANPRPNSAWTFVKDGAEQSVALNGRIRSTAAEAVREAVLADLGLAVASDGMLDTELGSGVVHELLADWRLPSIDIWAVFLTGRRAVPRPAPLHPSSSRSWQASMAETRAHPALWTEPH
jgi:DNA-binding transcriptional LysR family regulator